MRTRNVVLFVSVLLSAVPALAQDTHSEVSLNVAGFFPKDATAAGVTDAPSSAGGLLADYRFQFNRWNAAEANYSYTRFNQIYSYSGQSSTTSAQANIHEVSLAYVFTFGRPANARIRPFAEAGVGGLLFAPVTSASVAGASTQGRFAPMYGGGVDVKVTGRLSLRAGYRGVLYQAPDFSIATQVTNQWTHLAEPYLGISFRF